MQNVLITDYEYENVDIEQRLFDNAGIHITAAHCQTTEELLKIVPDMDGVITQYCDINREVITAMKHCRIIIKYGIGINNIDVEAATEKGIYVCNIPDYGIDEVSNQAIAFLFALARKLYVTNQDLRKGIWDYKKLVPVYRLSEACVGIVGFGRMGQAVARKLQPFGVRLLAFDTCFCENAAKELHVEKASLEQLVSESDYITLHCPATKENTGFFNDALFERMKPSAYLINTARGALVSQDALVRALEQKKIAGAGLDVFEQEPIAADNPLLAFPNVIVSGHTSWYSETAITNLHTKAAEEVIRVLKNEAPLNLCNKEVLK